HPSVPPVTETRCGRSRCPSLVWHGTASFVGRAKSLESIVFRRRGPDRDRVPEPYEGTRLKESVQTKPPRKRLIVGISGASGAIYGIRLLQLLKETDVETHLIVSRTARVTIATETDLNTGEVEALADVVHSNQDLGAACSSGSFQTLGMVIAPCSVKTMAEIATGVTANLISR